MRKPTVVVAVIIAVTLLACAVSGCNSEEKQAREYLNSAYEKSESVVENKIKFAEKGQELIDYHDGLSMVTTEDVQWIDQSFNELTGIVGAIDTAVEETKAEYQEVLGLEGVEKYKEYAENRIEVIDLVNEWAGQLKKFFDIFMRSLGESLAGGIPDENAIMEETRLVLDERDRIEAEIEKLNDEAADLREELDVD